MKFAEAMAPKPSPQLDVPSDMATTTSKSTGPAPAREGVQILPFPGTRERRDARKEALLKGLEQGLPVGTICNALGIGITTAYHWRKVDPAFARAWSEARESGWDQLEILILEAGKNDWRAMVRYLEANSDRWRRTCPACKVRSKRG